ncbi:Retrovirus-related Pol polyprotein from transposon RE1 [Vitis vinifera]|uniref:Retrovirus-related Pol polyprotein from transposon RE1 n=1 Tax=Vitis vinifera TaxID=29760 RepID=A0A438IEY8_VITVI|nr:Retrovirus-related Pol polyprotein from transposon RE1 [Vitis vinifera]
MNNDIGENFLLFGTAKDIWDAAKETYSSSENTSELFQVESALHDFRQGEQFSYSVLQHTHKQHTGKLWNKRTVQVLPRTNRELDDVRGRIMGIKPLPVSGRLFQSSGGDRQKRDRPWCDYCKKPGHYKETCWKLHGNLLIGNQSHGLTEMAEHTWLPTLRAPLFPSRVHSNKEQMEMLQKLLSQVGSGSTTGVAFTANRGGMRPWIVDTGDLKSGKMIGSAELCSGSTPFMWPILPTKSLKQVAYSLRSPNPSQFAPTELSTPMPPSVQPAQHTNVPSPVTIQSPMPIQPIAPQLANENLQVYIRRRKRQELEHGSQSTCGQYIDSNSSLPEENIGEDRAGEVLIPSIDDSTLPIALRKGVRRCTDHPIGNYVTYEGLSPSYRAFATSLDDTQVPNTIQEALKISEWKKAVQDEIDALEKNGTWTITDLPVGKRPVGCKWIFTIKYKADGSVERFKARLDPSLIGCQSRLVLATTGHKKCVSKWDLEEEVYMEIPPGFEESMAKNQNLKKYLSEEFEVKDLGNLKYFLGMEVARSRKGIVVSQRKYILDLLKETGMLGCKPIDTPMDSQKKLGIEKESTPVDRGRYQRLVGRLIYLSHTRPDIGFAVSAVSQFMHSPTEEHMEAVYRILRYLKMTPGKGLFFRKTENRDTEVYSDADWAGNIIDRRSTSGYCSFVWGNLVTWRSKKQSVVARSSAEAEYRALAQGICEGIWIKRVLSELGQTSSSPILMMCDNQAAISIAKNPVHHDRTKHVEIDRHFITEKVTSETVKLTMFLPSTKPQTSSPKLYLGLTSKT